jgi:plasmid stabilization system protein ParE
MSKLLPTNRPAKTLMNGKTNNLDKKAQDERKEILQYWKIHNQSTTYSRKLNSLIRKAVKLIAAYPHIGRRTDIENVRVKLVRDYLIFYEEGEDRVFIL